MVRMIHTMSIAIMLALLFMTISTSVATNTTNHPISLTFRQQISHNPAVPSPGTFLQRYFLSGKPSDVKPGAPVILYIGAETETGAWSVQEGVLEPTSWALNSGGIAVSVEHRYFGESLPFGNKSYTNEHLQYLTVENDLADCITILNHVMAQVGPGHPVLAYGGSYGGLLSAAIRLHYPSVINASLASAAPIYEFGEVLNSTWFDEVSETLLSVELMNHDDLAYMGNNDGFNPTSCGSVIASEFRDLWDSRNDPSAWPALQSRFHLCKPITTANEAALVLFWAKEAFSEIVQFSYPRAQPPCDVANAINVVCDAGVTDHIRLATNLIYNSTAPWGTPVSCFNAVPPSLDMQQHAMRTSPPTAQAVAPSPGLLGGSMTIQTIPWLYLCCTQIVMPVAGRGIFAAPAPYNLTATSAMCNNTYGVTPDPEWHRKYVLQPLSNATNIVFSNGGYDPVRGFAPATNLGPSLVALDIANMAHTFDLFATQPGDPQNVVEARDKEWKILRSMLYHKTDES